MKKGYVVLLTVSIEAILLSLASVIIGWALIDTLFLGSLVIFGSVWLFQLYTNQTTNELNAHIKGWNRLDNDGLKPFRFKISPITLGLLLFTLVSFFIAILSYYPYFI